MVSKIASLAVKVGAVLVIVLLNTQFAIDLQLIGGVLIMQTLPAVAIGLYTGWMHRWALIAGMAAGLLAGLTMLYQIPRGGGASAYGGGVGHGSHFGGSAWPLRHAGFHTDSTIYVGVVALAVNLLVVLVGTVLLRQLRAPQGEDITHPDDYFADEGDAELRRMTEIIDGTPVDTDEPAPTLR